MGGLRLDDVALDKMPRLVAVLHCAGSVRSIVSEELWRRGIAVSTSADVDAESVARFTYAAIVMAGKKAPFLSMDARRFRDDWSYLNERGRLGTAGRTVGLVGFSRIGRRVVRLLSDSPGVTAGACV